MEKCKPEIRRTLEKEENEVWTYDKDEKLEEINNGGNQMMTRVTHSRDQRSGFAYETVKKLVNVRNILTIGCAHIIFVDREPLTTMVNLWLLYIAAIPRMLIEEAVKPDDEVFLVGEDVVLLDKWTNVVYPTDSATLPTTERSHLLGQDLSLAFSTGICKSNIIQYAGKVQYFPCCGICLKSVLDI
ncbi:hypothetical protein Tco_0195488 [Tanacetum coccineum]